MRTTPMGVFAALSVVLACGSDSDSSSSSETDAGGTAAANPADLMPIGMGSGAVCPQGSPLTYDNFAKAFFDTYCIQCHASTLTGDARRVAPVGYDFDTLAGIRRWPNHIDQFTAAGPNATNTRMPAIPSAQGSFPSEDERKKLGEWLACGAP